MILDDMIALYRETAILYGNSQEQGNAARCNAASDKLDDLRASLRREYPDWRDKIRALLDDENRLVRWCAAVDALDFAPDEGLRVLRTVASGPRGMVRFDAEMVIEEWEAGRWPPGS